MAAAGAELGVVGWLAKLTHTRSPAARLTSQKGTPGATGLVTGGGEAARRDSATMQRALLAFARGGDPNYNGLPRWETISPPPARATLVFDVKSRLEDYPGGAVRRLFEKVPFIQQGS